MGNLLKTKEKQDCFYWHTAGQRGRYCSRQGSRLSSFTAWVQAFPSCCCPPVQLPSPLPSTIPLNFHICLILIHSPPIGEQTSFPMLLTSGAQDSYTPSVSFAGSTTTQVGLSSLCQIPLLGHQICGLKSSLPRADLWVLSQGHRF